MLLHGAATVYPCSGTLCEPIPAVIPALRFELTTPKKLIDAGKYGWHVEVGPSHSCISYTTFVGYSARRVRAAITLLRVRAVPKCVYGWTQLAVPASCVQAHSPGCMRGEASVHGCLGCHVNIAVALGQSKDVLADVTHELLHVAGLHHEHQRYDRDNHIELLELPKDWGPFLKHQFNKKDKPSDRGVTAGLPLPQYNTNSIMHYPDEVLCPGATPVWRRIADAPPPPPLYWRWYIPQLTDVALLALLYPPTLLPEAVETKPQ